MESAAWAFSMGIKGTMAFSKTCATSELVRHRFIMTVESQLQRVFSNNNR